MEYKTTDSSQHSSYDNTFHSRVYYAEFDENDGDVPRENKISNPIPTSSLMTRPLFQLEKIPVSKTITIFHNEIIFDII